MEFKEKLYRYRMAHNFTQEQMGAILGLTGTMIYRMESGRSKPSKNTLTKFEILTEREQ